MFLWKGRLFATFTPAIDRDEGDHEWELQPAVFYWKAHVYNLLEKT